MAMTASSGYRSPATVTRPLFFLTASFPGAARQTFPQLVKFGPKYGAVTGATWNGRDLDRRFLTPLSRPTWDSMAAQLASVLTDAVIDSAVALMPPEYLAINGEVLRTALKQRRADLPREADRYYKLLAGQVDLHATDHADSAAVIRVDGEQVRVKVFSEKARSSGAAPYIDRTFTKDETHDIRLFLHGDNDRAVFEGTGSMPITVRAIGGKGDDAFDDPGKNGKVHFYDESGESTAIGHGVDTKPWPKPPVGEVGPRDWGSKRQFATLVAGGPDIGILFGASASFFRYGFRKVPYSSKWRFRLGYATSAATLNGDILGDIRLSNSNTYFTILARASGIATLNFYGFGNNTPETESASFYRVRQQQYSLTPGITFNLTKRSTLLLMAKGLYSTTSDDQDRFIGTQDVLGTGDFGQIGAGAEIEWSAKNPSSMTVTGVNATLGGSVFAPVWSVPTTYGEVHGEVDWSWNLHPTGLKPTLGFRVGGKGVFGDYPFMSAAFIGGEYLRPQLALQPLCGRRLGLRRGRIPAASCTHLGVARERPGRDGTGGRGSRVPRRGVIPHLVPGLWRGHLDGVPERTEPGDDFGGGRPGIGKVLFQLRPFALRGNYVVCGCDASSRHLGLFCCCSSRGRVYRREVSSCASWFPLPWQPCSSFRAATGTTRRRRPTRNRRAT